MTLYGRWYYWKQRRIRYPNTINSCFPKINDCCSLEQWILSSMHPTHIHNNNKSTKGYYCISNCINRLAFRNGNSLNLEYPTHKTKNKTKMQWNFIITQITNKNRNKSFLAGLVHWHHAGRTNQKVVEYLDHYCVDTQVLVLQMLESIQRTVPYRRYLKILLMIWSKSFAVHYKPYSDNKNRY